MNNDLYLFKTRIQRDKFLKAEFELSSFEKSERGAISFQVKLESEFPGINNYSKRLDGDQGRDISDMIMDMLEIKYE